MTRPTPDQVLTFAKVQGPPDDWHRYCVFDVKTGEEIQDVIEVDTERGYLLRHLRDPQSGLLLTTPDGKAPRVEHLTGQFRLVRT